MVKIYPNGKYLIGMHIAQDHVFAGYLTQKPDNGYLALPDIQQCNPVSGRISKIRIIRPPGYLVHP
jgi:hypothetical protein